MRTIHRLLLCTAVATAAHAQEEENPNAIHIRVVDDTGGPVVGARVGSFASRDLNRPDRWSLFGMGNKKYYSGEDGRANITMDL